MTRVRFEYLEILARAAGGPVAIRPEDGNRIAYAEAMIHKGLLEEAPEVAAAEAPGQLVARITPLGRRGLALLQAQTPPAGPDVRFAVRRAEEGWTVEADGERVFGPADRKAALQEATRMVLQASDEGKAVRADAEADDEAGATYLMFEWPRSFLLDAEPAGAEVSGARG